MEINREVKPSVLSETVLTGFAVAEKRYTLGRSIDRERSRILRIYLVRHGETMWNREGRMQGHLDSPLTRDGVEQAMCVGRALGAHLGEDIDHQMVVSPLGRCRQTAALICEEAGLDYASCDFHDDLKEICWGKWDGHTFAEIDAKYPGELDCRNAERWDYVPPDGESYGMLAARVGRWLKALPDQGSRIVVAHGGVGRVFRGVYAGMEPQDMMDLEQPQDAFYLLEGGEIAKIDAGD